MVKGLLRRTLGKAVASSEELETISCDCEAIIDSSPLTYQSEYPEDLHPVPLTSRMILVQNVDFSITDVEEVYTNPFLKRLLCRKIWIE